CRSCRRWWTGKRTSTVLHTRDRRRGSRYPDVALLGSAPAHPLRVLGPWPHFRGLRSRSGGIGENDEKRPSAGRTAVSEWGRRPIYALSALRKQGCASLILPGRGPGPPSARRRWSPAPCAPAPRRRLGAGAPRPRP